MSRSHDAKGAFVRERRPIRFPLIHTTVIATTRYAVSLVRPGKRPISRTASTRHFGRVDGFAQDSRSKLFLQQRLSRGSRSTLVGGMARIEVGVRQPPWQSRSARRIKTYHALLAVALLDLAIIAGAGAVALLTVRHFYPTLAISQYVLMWSVGALGSLLFFYHRRVLQVGLWRSVLAPAHASWRLILIGPAACRVDALRHGR